MFLRVEKNDTNKRKIIKLILKIFNLNADFSSKDLEIKLFKSKKNNLSYIVNIYK